MATTCVHGKTEPHSYESTYGLMTGPLETFHCNGPARTVEVPQTVIERAITLIEGAGDMYAMDPGEKWTAEEQDVLRALREALTDD